jgi:hypothetical protein
VFAVLAAAAAVGGSIAWLAAGRRAVRARRLTVIGVFDQRGFLRSAGARREPATDDVVAVSGTTRYHRADCVLVRGKVAGPVARRGDAADGLRPCEMCRP